MKIQFESVHFTADQKLLDLISGKLEKLEQYHDKIISTNVTLKLGTAKQVKDKIMEVRMGVPGDVIFVKKVDSTFEAALDGITGALRKQLIKRKDIERAH